MNPLYSLADMEEIMVHQTNIILGAKKASEWPYMLRKCRPI
ncbi:hypothetical protein [Psychrobacillus sp. INOP01]|nr:hypothetical protein [Psychrobacillus sp. INOP01]